MRVFKRYSLDREERIEIVRNTASFLTKAGTVSFAYIYGSFSKEEGFNDIDLAVYIDESKVSNIFDAQLELGVSLEREIGYSVDCKAYLYLRQPDKIFKPFHLLGKLIICSNKRGFFYLRYCHKV